jgi:uncharacterized damage-inducible protein DinB
MTSTDLLTDAFERIREAVYQVVDGLTPEQLGYRIDKGANSIAWLVWHLTRIQDDHVAGVAGFDQVWTSAGWAERFGLPFKGSATGYGHGPDEVAAVRVASPDLLTGYFEAVHEQTARYIATLTEQDLARVVDTWWDPPVTLAVRLVSVIGDDLQHVGQAAFLRGHLSRTKAI